MKKMIEVQEWKKNNLLETEFLYSKTGAWLGSASKEGYKVPGEDFIESSGMKASKKAIIDYWGILKLKDQLTR